MINSVEEHIKKTQSENPKERLNALKQMCPCRVKEDIDLFWNRIFEMVNDTDDDVRWQVLHTICDGSPKHLEQRVADALEVFNHDSNSEIRRRAHKALGSYLRTGKWNVL
jgi:vesicle coat complex subunit